MKRIQKTNTKSPLRIVLNKMRSIFSVNQNARTEEAILGLWHYSERVKLQQKKADNKSHFLMTYTYTFNSDGMAEFVFSDSDGCYEKTIFQYYIKGNALYTKFDNEQRSEKYDFLLEDDILDIKLSCRQWVQFNRIQTQ